MSEILSSLQYTETHEWVRLDGKQTVVVGLTSHAQQQLGDVVFVELPEVDAEINAGGECGVVESVKTAADFYAPVSGTVVAVNEALVDQPALLNSDPYGDGWLVKIKLTHASELDDLLDSSDYEGIVAAADD